MEDKILLLAESQDGFEFWGFFETEEELIQFVKSTNYIVRYTLKTTNLNIVIK